MRSPVTGTKLLPEQSIVVTVDWVFYHQEPGREQEVRHRERQYYRLTALDHAKAFRRHVHITPHDELQALYDRLKLAQNDQAEWSALLMEILL